MLRTAEITAELTDRATGDNSHNLYWSSRLQFSVDCFVCERRGRTQMYECGAERALCSGSRKGFQSHYTAGRITAYDSTTGADRLALRALVDFWWAPFQDARDDKAAMAPTSHPWVRLHLGSHCPKAKEAGKHSIQSNLVRPHRLRCGHCESVIATDASAPTIRLLN
ncbi:MULTISPECIES: hypothetical protein [unclassified Streptomyces]|uniref:hypothetical protein n=1 Tax=unclassified Streptomyces TaxID=2593676 RepID=UPI00190E3193|nr:MULTISPECIES: hypothetical protein [unclassified Streptomyces]MBK3567588.1 hypothetical protein [Streptomyces sp. MBT62]MBK6015535.1 hypothetical protein [Streptomyces sp. MBT53]